VNGLNLNLFRDLDILAGQLTISFTSTVVSTTMFQTSQKEILRKLMFLSFSLIIIIYFKKLLHKRKMLKMRKIKKIAKLESKRTTQICSTKKDNSN